MRVVFVIPDERQLATAGVRIRYHRVAARLKAHGHVLDVVPIDDAGASLDHVDVCVFSKCHDARSIALADRMRADGALIGVDVFDDYYSDPTDSRFVHLREWLRTIASRLNFTICSTPLMSRKLAALLPQAPNHVMHDVSIDLDVEQIALNVERNAERALSSGKVDVTWFGIGDNRHFELGIADLHAFASALTPFADKGYEARVSILTNDRALDAERLEMIGRLPVSLQVEEWSEALERAAITRSLACFLPVRAQNFSVVKSLNRAITTLTGGAQALSSGYPLYDELRPFIYGAAADIVADLESGRLALRRETVPDLADRLMRWGNVEVEAQRLTEFLQGLPATRSRTETGGVRAIVHGRSSPETIHKFAKSLGYLSVASPFTSHKLPFDVQLALVPDEGAAVVLSPLAVTLLRGDLGRDVEPHGMKHGEAFSRIPLSSTRTMLPFDAEDLLTCRFKAVVAMRYDGAMNYLTALLTELFGPIAVTLSELDSPLWSRPRDALLQTPSTVAASEPVSI